MLFRPSNYIEVRNVLSALTDKVRNVPGTFTIQDINKVMTGMQGMTRNHPEVIEILSALSDSVRRNVQIVSNSKVTTSVHIL